MKKKSLWIAGICISLALVAVVVLPVEEQYSAFQFRFFPELAKAAHFIRLAKTDSDQIIYLLGTVHSRHFYHGSTYPYWQLRSVIETLRPQRLILEIRPQEYSNGTWGASPPEMSYAAIIAKKVGIDCTAMDYWEKNYNPIKDFEKREDHMEKLITKEVERQKVSLVLTGYSHIPGLSRRLLSRGFILDHSFSSSDKRALLSKTINTEIPEEYFAASEQAILMAEKGSSDFNVQWANERKRLLDYIREKP